MIPDGVSVTLVEPRGPVNVGHVARLVKNFGVRQLYLVKPKVDLSVAAVYASHATEVLDAAVITSLKKIREEKELLVATTAVRAKKKSNVIRRTLSPDSLRDLLAASKTSSIVFGRDTTGLTNEEIAMCDATVTIDAAPGYRAMNIGHAAAILLYLASRGRRGEHHIQSRVAREVFARSLSELGEATKAPRHKTRTYLEVGKRIAASSNMTDSQLNLLSGIFQKALSTIESGQEGDSKT